MSADIELYEDHAGEWRWRLVHENGNILADSGEGYASKSGAREAIDRVIEYGPETGQLEIDASVYEIYEDAAGEWRWRLRHRNGEILADSGEGYGSRADAVEGINSVKRNVVAAPRQAE